MSNTIDILTPVQAHEFAATERIRAAEFEVYADRMLERVAAFRHRATLCRQNAAAFDAAARGEWGI